MPKLPAIKIPVSLLIVEIVNGKLSKLYSPTQKFNFKVC